LRGRGAEWRMLGGRRTTLCSTLCGGRPWSPMPLERRGQKPQQVGVDSERGDNRARQWGLGGVDVPGPNAAAAMGLRELGIGWHGLFCRRGDSHGAAVQFISSVSSQARSPAREVFFFFKKGTTVGKNVRAFLPFS